MLYALTHATNDNSDFRSFDNDCTNFISQVMRTGGWKHVLRVPHVMTTRSRRTRTSLLVLVGVAALVSCGRGPSAEDDRRARERVLVRYLDAIEVRDAEAALKLVNPRTRATAGDEVAGVMARLGGRDLDAASVTYGQSISPGFAVATVTLAGVPAERVELGRVDGAWFVSLGAAPSDRTPSTVSP